MGWKKKQKKETAEELKARLAELEGDKPEEEEDLDVPPEPPKKAKKTKTEPEPKGEFSLDIEEMAILAQLAVGSEEYKIYQQGLVGQKLDKIVTEYNKVVGEKSEAQPEETDEEELPTE